MDEPFLSMTGNEKISKEVKSKEIISYSEPKLDLSLLRKQGNSKTYPGMMIQKMKEARAQSNLDVAMLIQYFYKEYIKFERIRNLPLIKIDIIDGWKGKDKINISIGFENDFLIETHNKDKETGKISTSKHTIPRENVNRILFFINKWKIGESHECYDFATVIGERDWEEVWKKRMKVYFPCYYYPVKILEKLGVIKYSGRGTITRLK
ncbi:MAG: hypothetical protein WC758_07605 [Candidatus Woesearchaeota archaeon]|jgi:hypothetical protein